MRKFDTKVQYLKYKVLREVARLAWNDTLLENLFEIPKTIVPGNTPTMRSTKPSDWAATGSSSPLRRNNPRRASLTPAFQQRFQETPGIAGLALDDLLRRP